MGFIQELRRALRPLRVAYEGQRVRLRESAYGRRQSTPGSERWLIESEVHYGGFATNVERRKVSASDPRTKEQLAFGGMTGGDRMLHNGYAGGYAKHLAPFIGKPNLTVVEFGILKGTGLAIWCDLFSDTRVVGLDIDLSHFADNRLELERRGAFRSNAPELFEYDQFLDGQDTLRSLLKGRSLDIVIDDGFHFAETILKTWRSCRPFLTPKCVYFIEDFAGLLDAHADEFDGFASYAYGALTVIERTS